MNDEIKIYVLFSVAEIEIESDYIASLGATRDY